MSKDIDLLVTDDRLSAPDAQKLSRAGIELIRIPNPDR